MNLKNISLYATCLMLFVLLSSKKCSSPPPSPVHPQPSVTKKPTSTWMVLPFAPIGGGIAGENSQYAFPSAPGYNPFPPGCVFTKSTPAFINMTIKYTDANGIDQVWGIISKTNTDILVGPGAPGPYLSLDDLPETGHYWIELEYIFTDCTDCCADYNAAGTGWVGCLLPPPPGQWKGKPKITAKSWYKDYPGPQIGALDWEEWEFICVCNC